MKGRHLSAVGLERRNIGFDPSEIVRSAAPGEPGEYVIDAEKQAPLGQVCQEADEVVAPALDFNVLAFGEIENTDVHCGAARHPAGDLFTEEEIRAGTERLGGIDGIMVGDRNQIHALVFQDAIDLPRIVVGFAANVL
jgi:hypothetical protein